MVYGYIRVSADKQTTENQRFEIENFCVQKEYIVNSWIEDNSLEIVDTYNYEDNTNKSLKPICHIRHIRNAVSHGNIELGQEKDCIFMDSMVCKGKLVTYKLRMKLTNIGKLMGKLIEVQQPFVADMIKKQNSSI